MKEIKYYPLDTDPFARAHVVLSGNNVLFEDHMGHRFALVLSEYAEYGTLKAIYGGTV